MSDSPTLDKLVAVSPRFARSVSLVRDAHRTDALQGYILTPTGRDVLRRWPMPCGEIHPPAPGRSPAPTGPASRRSPCSPRSCFQAKQEVRNPARKFLAAHDADLSERFFGASGPLPKKARTALPGAGDRLAAAAGEGTRRKPGFVPPRHRPARQAAADRRAAGADCASKLPCPGRPSSGCSRRLTNTWSASGNAAGGILLIVDELGKFLEYGATNPEQGDVFVLQELAEAATRSKRPFLFVTILHQALDRYAEHMSRGRRAEWAKVQGRFEDVAFEERTEQLLRLLAHAIRH